MASNAGITGKNAYISFGGTTLHTDYRNLNADNSIATVDQSAGADDGITRLTTLEDSTFSVEVKRPAGSSGTTNWAGLVVGSEGTFEYGPEGTATGKPKSTVNAILVRRSHPVIYNNVVIDTYEFEQDDANGVAYSTY